MVYLLVVLITMAGITVNAAYALITTSVSADLVSIQIVYILLRIQNAYYFGIVIDHQI